MSSLNRYHPKRADMDNRRYRVWSTDDRDGFVTNHYKLNSQKQWSGNQLIDTKILVSDKNLDEPQPQLRTLILPQDPAPIYNARPEPYEMDEA